MIPKSHPLCSCFCQTAGVKPYDWVETKPLWRTLSVRSRFLPRWPCVHFRGNRLVLAMGRQPPPDPPHSSTGVETARTWVRQLLGRDRSWVEIPLASCQAKQTRLNPPVPPPLASVSPLTSLPLFLPAPSAPCGVFCPFLNTFSKRRSSRALVVTSIVPPLPCEAGANRPRPPAPGNWPNGRPRPDTGPTAAGPDRARPGGTGAPLALATGWVGGSGGRVVGPGGGHGSSRRRH